MSERLFKDGTDGGYALASATEAAVYTCPAGHVAKLDIWFANRTGGALTIRLSVRRGGADLSDAAFLLYDFPVAANRYKRIFELDVLENDIVTAYASDTGISTNIFVKEIRKLHP